MYCMHCSNVLLADTLHQLIFGHLRAHYLYVVYREVLPRRLAIRVIWKRKDNSLCSDRHFQHPAQYGIAEKVVRLA